MFSFDEELHRELQREGRRAPVYHVGRGGAGNVFAESKSERQRKESMSDGDSERSVGSEGSDRSGAEVATRWVKGVVRRVM
jgi:hypothetical protein